VISPENDWFYGGPAAIGALVFLRVLIYFLRETFGPPIVGRLKLYAVSCFGFGELNRKGNKKMGATSEKIKALELQLEKLRQEEAKETVGQTIKTHIETVLPDEFERIFVCVFFEDEAGVTKCDFRFKFIDAGPIVSMIGAEVTKQVNQARSVRQRK